MVAGQSEDEPFAVGQDSGAFRVVPGQKGVGLHAVTRVLPDQRFQGGAAIANQDGEHFVRDRKDVPPRLAGQAIVEDAELQMGLDDTALHKERAGLCSKVFLHVHQIAAASFTPARHGQRPA